MNFSPTRDGWVANSTAAADALTSPRPAALNSDNSAVRTIKADTRLPALVAIPTRVSKRGRIPQSLFQPPAVPKSILTIACVAATILVPIRASAADAEVVEGGWYPLIFYAINFLLFLWIVRRYGWPGISHFFHERARNIHENRARAESSYQQALELANRASERLQQLETEKGQIASELEHETRFQIDRIHEMAQEAVNRIQRDNAVTLAALREAAQRRLRESMAAAAGTIAREMLRRDFQSADQARLLQSFVERIGEEARR
jgi:F-type H+-transporting ATPase subunit b